MSLADGNVVIKLSDLTPQWLRDNYLTGLEFVDRNNRPFPDSFYDNHMQNALRKIERLCDITILPLTIQNEAHDYHVTDYLNWGWLQLFKVPVISVQRVRGVFPLGGEVVYPTEWIQVSGESGQCSVVPAQGNISAMIIGQGGSFLPITAGGVSKIPNMWRIDYCAGMDSEDLPRMIVEAIAKLACVDLLTILSALVRPIGVTSESASIDGLSQSMSYAQPAFQSNINQYTADLYGPQGKQQDLAMTSGLLKQILDCYRPMNMVSV